MRLHTGSLDIPCSGMNHYFARVPSHAPDILLYKQESIIIIIMVRTIYNRLSRLLSRGPSAAADPGETIVRSAFAQKFGSIWSNQALTPFFLAFISSYLRKATTL